MRVLLACEMSGRCREAFRSKGHDAWSCDTLPNDSPYHLQCDVRDVLKGNWDLVIAFPPCTDLAVSGARYFKEKQASGQQQRSIDFFMLFPDCAPKTCVENPIGIMSRLYRKPDQIIQPWMFGHPESKATCLWLKGLPKLIPSDTLPRRKRWDNQTPSGQNKLGPSADRAMLRGLTYQGIADAMAEQWGKSANNI